MARTFKRSSVALAVLTLLLERPMHPYEMQRLIKERGKNQVINVQQRASLYQTIAQLQRAGLIAVHKTAHQDGLPDKTIYKITKQGHETAVIWLREMLATPAQAFPEFPAAVSFLPLLRPEDALQQLQTRAATLSKRVAEIDAEMADLKPKLDRLFLLESEYLKTTIQAELTWVQAVVADLKRGKLTWTEDWMKSEG